MLFLLVLSLAVIPSSSVAQRLPLEHGDRVRLQAITLAGVSHGFVASVATDSLRVTLDVGGAPIPLALKDVVRLEVRRRTGTRRGGIIGASIGAVLGMALSYSLLTDCSGSTQAYTVCSGAIDANGWQERALAIGGGGVAFAAVGFFLGALTGRNRWELLLDQR